MAHLGEGVEEHFLSFPAGEASGKGDHGDVCSEAVVGGLLLHRLVAGDGVWAEHGRVGAAVYANELRGVGVVRLDHVAHHVV